MCISMREYAHVVLNNASIRSQLDLPLLLCAVRQQHLLHCQVKDPWLRVRLRQEILGIAKLYSATGPYRAENEYPMLVAEAHFNLAKAYADAQCAAQATDHCKK